VQCSALSDQPACGDGKLVPVYVAPGVFQFQCDRFLTNDPHYIVNENLTEEAPPPIPDNSATWPYFIYVGDAVFGDRVELDISQKAAFERLLLKLRPLQNWIVTLIDYVDPLATLLTEGDDPITTETDVELLT
jgi:hypothetical protein